MNEELYLVAYKDIEQKEIDEALWLKAMAHAGGDKTRAKWAYIDLRVDQMQRDPSLRNSSSRKIRKPTHQSGAYMMWFSILFFMAIITAGVIVDFEAISLVINNGIYFIDIPSLVFVLPTAIFFGISATSWRSYGRCWSYTLGGAKQVSYADANSVARCLKVMGDVSLTMGIIGTFIGAILITQKLEQFSNIGHALNVASLTLVYGIVLKLVSFVAEQRVRNLYLN
ncbi:MAG: hypothetical protein H8E38_07685 [SAR324 cluster bacterium]|nr:hypothetical protein [SAR324 cluster bacterium]MBL7034542.1 hypothetical protein [SAR324 cluster bacterium]